MRSVTKQILACLLMSAAVWAQVEVFQERVISISASIGYEVDPAEREKYDLFPEARGFLQAEIVEKTDGYWLRMTLRRDRDRILEQTQLTDLDLAHLRAMIDAVDQAVRSGARVSEATQWEKEGRLRLATDGFLYGMWLYGPGSTRLLGLDGRSATGVGLLVTGGSFAMVLQKTRDFRLGYGRSKLLRWGNYAGTFYGVGIPALFGADSDRIYFASAMTLTPLGGYLTHRLSAGHRIGKGESDLTTTGMWVGALYGMALPYLIDVSDQRNSTESKIYLGAAMAGVPIGGWATSRFVRGRPINRGRGHLIFLGGVLAVAEALTVADLVDDGEHPRLYVTAAMLALPVGVRAAYRLTENEDYTLGRARMISVGTYVGGLAGRGVGYTLGVNGDRVNNVAATLGATFGLWYTHRTTQGWGERVTSVSQDDGLVVSLPSPESLVMLGWLSRRVAGEAVPMELLRVEF
ncbi:MAG: hypothetical protein HOM68_01495 [Gemmatimonadetes bacterium]|nr:hypothetical protein [Gemmatimonadota bacterium]MBT5055186.1 hypothetical protein [Gemmatimonadota bacterium]MBT5145325.1 hypothetical protein [Gemmatimonadota bacterium]MBT5591513.1 hypothetical protein [Gemmatimonadota bacterium]MBT5962032.1 hypothetical protein [Gemmatimonadota bacterium]